MKTPQVPTRPWTRAEYDRLIAIGVLEEGEPIDCVAPLATPTSAIAVADLLP